MAATVPDRINAEDYHSMNDFCFNLALPEPMLSPRLFEESRSPSLQQEGKTSSFAAPRCIWSGEKQTLGRKPCRRVSTAEIPLAHKFPVSRKSEMSHQRRSSIDANPKEICLNDIKQLRKPPQKESRSRRAMSVDGDAAKTFQKENILRPQYLDVSKLFTFQKELGRGAFGVVNKCSLNLSGQLFACKTILKSNIKNELDLNDLKSEVSALQAMSSVPDVIKLSGVFEDSKSVHLVTEYCEGGDLFDRVKRERFFSETEAAIIVRKLAAVLAAAHSKGIMHRDIKPENILLASKTSNTDIRLADFGSSASFKQGQKLNQLIGSPLYIAPSVLQHSYGTEADMWSLGVLMYILLCGMPPFLGKNNVEIFRNVQHGKLNLERGMLALVSAEAKHLITLLLNRKAEEAISATDVLDHPWIKLHSQTVSRKVAPETPSFYGSQSEEVNCSNSPETYSMNIVTSPEASRRRNSVGTGVVSPAECHKRQQNELEDDAHSAMKCVLLKKPAPYSRQATLVADWDAMDDTEDEENEEYLIPAQVITLESMNSSANSHSSELSDVAPLENEVQAMAAVAISGRGRPGKFDFFKVLAGKTSLEC